MNNYSNLEPTPSFRVTEPDTKPPTRSKCRILLFVTGALLVIAAVACAVSLGIKYSREGRKSGTGPTLAMKQACGLTRYPTLCMNTLVDFPGASDVGSPTALAHISMNLTLSRLDKALSDTTEIRNWEMDTLSRSAYEDCLELLEESVDMLANSLTSSSSGSNAGYNQAASKQDVMTWLSGAMTNQDTCNDGLNKSDTNVVYQMSQNLQDLTELVSNSLAIYAASDDLSGTPIQNRRLLGFEPEIIDDESGFPKWMSRSDRELLDTPAPALQADIIVAQDGSGTVKTIAEAIKMAPENSARRTIIVVKAGTYIEKNLKVGRKKTNLWFLGEGKGKTVIKGSLSVGHDQITTFHTAAFAATGTGFVARDITFVNEAGPDNHQAVALRVGADHAVIYRCEIKGYQDTLYVHSQRQFYRECDIYGTVDFIFGNAAVVFQRCSIWARKPSFQQKNTITAQNRKDPNQNTGISIHACEIKPTLELEPVKSSSPTYLGRPWKALSRVVVMESYLGDHIDPSGWLAWNETAPIDKLYYGEYGNVGPRADISMRVKWPGVHAAMSKAEASQFTVAQFIFGQAWITSTGVAYESGLMS